MNNFNEATDAMKKMQDSEGALAEANAIAVDSVQGHIQRLKNAFVEFSQSAISKEFIKDFVDFAKGALNAVSAFLKFINAIGGLKTVLPLVVSFFAIFKGQSIIASINKMSTSVETFVSTVKTMFQDALSAAQDFGDTMTLTSETTASAAEMINAAMGVIGIAAAVASAIVSLIQGAIDKAEENMQKRIDKGLEAVSSISEIESAYAEYSELAYSGSASTDELVASLDALYKSLGKSGSGFEEAGRNIEAYKAEIEQLILEQEKLKLSDILAAIPSADKQAEDKLTSAFSALFENLSVKYKWKDYGDGTSLGFLDNYFSETLGIDISTKSSISDWINMLDTIEQKMLEVGEASNYNFTGYKGDEYTALKIFYDNIKNALSDTIELSREANEAIVNIKFHEIDLSSFDNTRESFDTIRDGLIEAAAVTPGFTGGIKEATNVVDAMLSLTPAFESFYTAAEKAELGTSAIARGLQGIQDVANGTSAAVEQLDNILKGDDYDTGLEKRVEYYAKLLEEVEGENWGGKHYAALAEYFDIDINQSVDEQIAAIERLRAYFSDADQGMYNFLMDINERVPEAIAHFNEETGTLEWDSAELQQFADAMEISKDALVDLLDAYIQHVPPSEWMKLTPEETAAWLDADKVLQDFGDTLLLNRQKFDELADAAGVDAEALLSSIMALEGYNGDNLYAIGASAQESAQNIRNFLADTASYGMSAKEQLQAVADSLSSLDAETIKSILVELDLPENTVQDLVSYLPEELQSQINIDDEEALSAIETTKQQLIDLGLEIGDFDGNIVITVTDNGQIQHYQRQINILATQLQSLGNTVSVKSKNAKGTMNARPGLSLLGDEYSASGQPKPELVVSGNRAYLAGVNGPVVGMLNAGDVVYTYQQTKKILGNNLNKPLGIPAFSGGTSSRWWNKLSGTVSSSYSGSSAYSSYYGNSSGTSGSSASSSGSGDNWFEQQYELHNHYRKLDQETDAAYLTWLVNAWKQAYAEGIIELKDAHKYEEEAYELMKKIASQRFTDEYNEHRHMVALGKETDQEYYSWLEWRHKTAYANNEITLEEYWKYEEEVYKKRKELISDYFNDIDHTIDMLENAGKSDLEIIKWDEEGMKYVEKQIAELIKQGKTNNDSEVQDMQKTWWNYYNDRKKREEDYTKNAKNAAKELVDYRMKMLKKDLDNEKDTLNKRLNALRDFYSEQKSLLQDAADQDKYLDDQAEKRKAVSDLEIQLAQLEYDNSAWAQKRKLELAQELADAQKELDDFEKDHALKVAQETLDKLQEMQEKELDSQIEAVEKTATDEAALYEQALKDVQNGGEDLYRAMIEYNNTEGTGNPEDIAEMWDEAYTSLKKYKELFGEYYKDINLHYGTDITPTPVDTSKIDAGNAPKEPVTKQETKPANTTTATPAPAVVSTPATPADPVLGSAVMLKSSGKLAYTSYDTPTLTPAYWVQGKTLYVQAVYPGRNAPYHIGTTPGGVNDPSTWVGFVNKWQLQGYASGTMNASPGIHEINERGDEALFKTKDGSTYRLFSGGEHVFNSAATNFLHDFANSPQAVLAKLFDEIGSGLRSEIKNNTISQNISLGDIIIQGNANERTVSEIRREKRAEIDYMITELNRLSRA